MRVNWLRAAAVLGLVVVPGTRGQAPDAAGRADRPEATITATGTARVERAPDYVDVSLGIGAYAIGAGEAQSVAQTTIKAVLAAIGQLQLPGKDVQTGSVTLSPRYDQRTYAEAGPREILGYDAAIMVRVRTTDLASPAPIIDAALAAGANRVDYVRFGIKEALEAREEAIAHATDAASRKAQAVARGAGAALAQLIEAEAIEVKQGGWWAGNVLTLNRAPAPAEAAALDTGDSPIVPGRIEVWAEVRVKYAARLP